jgi:hypothetical protein
MSQTIAAELLDLGDQNVAEFIRHIARAGEETHILEEDGLLLVAGSHPNPGPYRNVAMRIGDGLSAEEVFARADAFFGGFSRGYCLWVRMHADRDVDEIATERGFRLLEEEGLPQLARAGAPDPVEPGPGIELRWAVDEQSRRDFLMVNADAWGMGGAPYDLVRATLFEPSILDAPNVTAAIAYIDDKPAGTCMSINYPPHVAGGYWGGTAGWARKRGLHDLTSRAIFHAAAEQLGATISVSQTSPGAAKNLERMGLQQISSFKRYLVPKAHS